MDKKKIKKKLIDKENRIENFTQIYKYFNNYIITLQDLLNDLSFFLFIKVIFRGNITRRAMNTQFLLWVLPVWHEYDKIKNFCIN